MIAVEIVDPDLCGRFHARVIDGVKVEPSPAWIAERLTALGMRSINNVVDASNYVMLELGQPNHTYDLAKLPDGILRVRARDMRTGTEQEVDVKPSYGLTEQEVERMLRESIERAQDDISERMVVEARTEAETLVQAARKTIDKHAGLIDAPERSTIEESIGRLGEAMKGIDHRLVRSITDELDAATEPLAQRVLNSSVQESLGQKRIEEV